MKIEIDNQQLVADIAREVIKEIKPLLLSFHDPKCNELMSVSEVAKYLKVTQSWVYERTHTRQIPFRKAGKFPRFLKKDIDLWMLNPYDPILAKYNLKIRKGVRE